jgi:glutathione synthase/RimK-type ligase-like ATP-grasp enzyme
VYAQSLVSACRLPADVEAGVLALVEALGLRYAAIDFRRSDDGCHHFLEANPAGQWLFLEDRTGQPITRAVAEALVEASRPAARQPAPRGRAPQPARVPWSQAC